MIDPYEILGVDPKADKEEIKKAYRRKAKKHHPDRGGEQKDMSILLLCYDTLLDDEKRQRFDNNGEMDGVDTPPKDNKAYNYLTKKAGELVSSMMEKGISLLTTDMILLFSTAIQEELKGVPAKIMKLERGRKELEKCKKKFKQKPGSTEEDFLIVWLTREVQNFDKNIAALEASMLIMQQAKAVVDSYTFEMDRQDFMSTLTSGGSWRNISTNGF